MTKTSFIGLYGPLIAALIALSGVVLTLLVTARRERDRYVSQREDEYRGEQRIAIAAVVEATQIFRMTCGRLADGAFQRSRRDDGVSIGQAQAAAQTLLNKLSVARLLIHESVLQNVLDSLYGAWRSQAGRVNAIADAVAQEVHVQCVSELEEGWQEFDRVATALQDVALDRLKPTVLDTRE